MFSRICAASLAFGLCMSAQAFAQDAKVGETVFKKCLICHAVGPDAKSKVGPILNDVIGRKAGERDDFKYSPAMKEAGEKGTVWNDENLSKYLENPRDFIPKNKMAFVGLKKEDERANVIAFLKLHTPEKK